MVLMDCMPSFDRVRVSSHRMTSRQRWINARRPTVLSASASIRAALLVRGGVAWGSRTSCSLISETPSRESVGCEGPPSIGGGGPGREGGGALEERRQLRVIRRHRGKVGSGVATRPGVTAKRGALRVVGDDRQTTTTCRITDRLNFHLQTF
jgi:hypothetical protein